MKYFYFLLISIFCFSCNNNSGTIKLFSVTGKDTTEDARPFAYINEIGKTIQTRYNVPTGYKRKTYATNEFGYHLQHLPLKAHGEKVKYYNGKEKNTPEVYSAVIDLPIGTKDLHQCADAAMRLRADYLYQQKRFSEIAFNFNDGKSYSYLAFSEGDYAKEKYWKYMEYIFMYANTASLKQQLQSVPKEEVQIGDILLQAGNPYGHAVIIVDMAQNEVGEKVVLLAQSYMPAQELQVLKNPYASDDSPWYEIHRDRIITPEWKFTFNDWKTW